MAVNLFHGLMGEGIQAFGMRDERSHFRLIASQGQITKVACKNKNQQTPQNLLQWLHRLSLGMDKQFRTTHYN